MARPSKNQLRRARRKEKRTEEPVAPVIEAPSSLSSLARKFEWINEDDPLYEMYSTVSARFKRSLEDEPTDPPPTAPVDFEDDTGLEDTEEVNCEGEPSRKQRRMNRPTLGELKQTTTRPERVEWFDTDAPYPDFLVFMKTLPHAIAVPANWRARSDIPQFGSKSAYELPPNVRQTGISEAREDGRAAKRLDIDYERMHAAFYTPEGEQLAEPAALLPYGQIADLQQRGRQFRPQKPRSNSEPPASVSSRLRKALHMGPTDDVPWKVAIERLGLAPGYMQPDPVRRWGAFT